MEVLQACRLGDGRLVVLAVGVCRLRVLRETQGLPYSRADAEVLLDAEEQAAMEPLALQVGRDGRRWAAPGHRCRCGCQKGWTEEWWAACPALLGKVPLTRQLGGGGVAARGRGSH